MHDSRQLVPPEFVALPNTQAILDDMHRMCNKQVAGPKIIGWTFQVHKLEVYYAKCNNKQDYVTMFREHAQVYSNEDVMIVSRNSWNWGRKNKGKWRAVYEH